MSAIENAVGECPTCWGDGYIDHDLGREACTDCWGSGVTKTDAGVGTGAGEGATGQDTGTAWVTRSEDCPEAPAQAHPLVAPPAATLCISCTVDKAEPVECMSWDDECLTCHLTRCRACQDDLADQAAAEAGTDGRWS